MRFIKWFVVVYLTLCLFAALAGVIVGVALGADRFHAVVVGYVPRYKCLNLRVEGVEVKEMKAGTGVIVHVSCEPGDPV